MTSQFHCSYSANGHFFWVILMSPAKEGLCSADAHARTHIYFDDIWHNQPKITAEISNFWLFLLSYGWPGTRTHAQNAHGLYILPPHLATSGFVWLCVHIISLLRVTHANVLDRISDQHSMKTTQFSEPVSTGCAEANSSSAAQELPRIV